MNSLHTYQCKSVPLERALAAFPPGGPGAVALVYAPQWCGFARLDQGQLRDSTGAAPAGAYEVRVFDARAELRWLKDPRTADGTGTATLINEEPVQNLPDGWGPADRKESVIDTNGVAYLLWGEHAPAPQSLSDGWSLLGLARIGKLPVPVEGLAPKQRVLLVATEYIGADEYGSAYVFEERLTGLKIDGGNDNG